MKIYENFKEVKQYLPQYPSSATEEESLHPQADRASELAENLNPLTHTLHQHRPMENRRYCLSRTHHM